MLVRGNGKRMVLRNKGMVSTGERSKQIKQGKSAMISQLRNWSFLALARTVSVDG